VRADELKAAQRIALVHLLCEQCGRPMSIRGRDGQRRTCSARCRNAQRGPQTIGVARAVIEAKGWARPLRGKTWEDVYGADGAARRRANMVSQGRRRLGKSYEDLTDSVTAAEWRRKAGSTWRGKTPEELLGPERAAALREVRRQHLLARGPLAVAMSRRGEPSRLELTMRALLDRLGIRFEPQASVAGRQVDLYLPDYKLVIECDGEYWHQRPESQARDARNTAALEAAGYTVLRFGGQEIERRLDTVQARLLRVVANHEGRYVTGEVEIESVRVRIENSREASLYDLAVEEDRSYIVNGGIVSHNSNCLCLLTVLARP
jgi:very-short-patch-repair endonuclease